ncbi:Regulator of polyketide synthase expression [Mycobacterium liflandii 128FXT]|uniref:Regulator of polyketide synthase expression n=1 Tax=Mycobacterium liflandii (strain 128FXT) TaxID=459424 RepID=L7V526_MYCL1|nr:helix-turn-helix domain-containing protein [Mycobacterium liflandii]AGC61670.1 Regulator of polyketide synthase expression [Mycobacterium liflandii 128FXT]
MAADRQQDSVDTWAVEIVTRLGDLMTSLVDTGEAEVVSEVGELREDALLTRLLHDSIRANIETVFSAIRHGIRIENVEPPTAALEHARRLAQREVSVNSLVRSYRLGHKAVLDVARGQVRALKLDQGLSLDVFGRIEQVTFGYVDHITQEVVNTYQSEHDRWTENRNSLRALRVREVLDGAQLDVDAMTTEIRYPLNLIHLATVMWFDGPALGNELAIMQGVIRQFGQSVGASASPLFIPVDRLTGWAWVPLTTDTARNAVTEIREFTRERTDIPWIAVGDPLPHVAGFRRSHWQARDARSVAIVLGSNAHRVTAAGDPGLSMAGLLGRNIEDAAAWVGQILGPLASQTDSDERLRETLRAFLRSGSSFKAAAEELHLHHNSVKYRVQRAIKRRGRPLTDDRLDVEVALLLCHWYGAAVLG